MIKSGFDLVAPFYDFLASLVFGPAIRQSQTEFLNYLPPKACILVIGGGTGWILPELIYKTAPRQIVYLEASANMLNRARRRIQNPTQAVGMEFRLGTEKNIGPEEKFDAVISHFFLDLFLPHQLENITSILAASLRPGGVWLVADFVQTPGPGIRNFWNRLLTKSMYVFFGVVSNISAVALPDWENILAKKSLVPQKSTYFYHHLIKSILYQKR